MIYDSMGYINWFLQFQRKWSPLTCAETWLLDGQSQAIVLSIIFWASYRLSINFSLLSKQSFSGN